MKRAFLRKVKPVSCSPCVFHSQAGDSEQTPSGVKRRARTSAAMVGLALSMGATSLLVPRQGDSAGAAESKVSEATPSSVSRVAALPTESGVELTTGFSAESKAIEHTVRAGQTLRQIARRYGLSVEALAAANNLNLTSTLVVGQVLKVPGVDVEAAKAGAAQSPQLLALADLSRLPSPGPARGGSVNQVQAERDQAINRLKQEQNKLKNSLAELRRGESDSSVIALTDAIESGSESVMKPSLSEQSQQVAELPRTLPMVSESVPTLASLPGPTTSTTVQDALVAASPGPDLDWMRVNQSLLIPGDESAAVEPASQPEVPAATALPSLSEQTTRTTAALPQIPAELTPAPIVDVEPEVSYRVHPGDTVARIARAHNITQSTLISANGLSNPNVIFVGQVLKVPSAQQAETTRQNSPSVPSVLPASTTSESSQTLTNVSLPTVPVQVASTQPRSLAVVPSSIAPMTPEASTPEAEVRPGSSSSATRNPYVQTLLSEVKALRERRSPSAEAAAPEPTVVAAATSSTGTAANLRGDTVLEPRPLTENAPETLRTPTRAATPVRVTTPARETTPTVVAAAPLGSENYEPLLQPVTGRMVSPDLPSLPGADHFLPDGVLKGYIWPARGVLTSGYGWRWGRMHRGIDIASDVGTPIHAAANGVVEYAGWNSGGYGNMIEVRHSDGSMTRYAHLNAIYVQQGQRVRQSEQIGEMGSTGYSTGPHLHFEVHLPDEGTVNPMAYLPAE